MRHLFFPALSLLCSSFAMPVLGGDHGPHWGYEGDTGPAHWGELAPEFAACSSGKNQSPVDIATVIDGPLAALDFSYGTAATTIFNNGHTVQLSFEPGSELKVDGLTFGLKQVHFHTPSENRIDGKSYPLEAHLVHASADGQLAVVAVIYELGQDNSVLASSWAQLPTTVSDPLPLSSPLKAAELLPAKRDYYRYSGSLTTPPCSEGVRWLVFKDHPQVSKAQVERFVAALGGRHNNRPVQPYHARQVVE